MEVVFIIIILTVAVSIYLLDRNKEVFIFSQYIVDLAYLYNLRRIKEFPKKYRDAYT